MSNCWKLSSNRTERLRYIIAVGNIVHDINLDGGNRDEGSYGACTFRPREMRPYHQRLDEGKIP